MGAWVGTVSALIRPTDLPTTTPRHTARLSLAARAPVRRAQHVTEMGVVEAFTSYADIFAPTIRSVVESANIPAPALKWFHGLNMVRRYV